MGVLVGTDLGWEYPRHKYVPIFGKCGHCGEHEHHWMHSHHDHDFDQVAARVPELMDRGFIFYQKWSCVHCGSRQTMSTVNKLFYEGICEECGNITNIKANGCNYLLIGGRGMDSLMGT